MFSRVWFPNEYFPRGYFADAGNGLGGTSGVWIMPEGGYVWVMPAPMTSWIMT